MQNLNVERLFALLFMVILLPACGGSGGDNPSNKTPIANNDSFTVNEGSSNNTLNLATNDTDAEGALDLTSIVITSGSSHGSITVYSNGTIGYSHDGSESIFDSFTYTIADSSGAVSAVATVNLTIIATNDAPVATSQSIATSEGAPVTITLGSDVEGDALTNNITAAPAHGTLSGSGASVTYTPNPFYSGMDSFSFTLNDGTVDSSVEIITLTVTAVNDAPVANSQSVTTNEDTPLAITLGSDVDGDALTNSITAAPAHGTLSGTGASVTYTPAANYNGDDSFSFTLNDGTVNSSTGTITLTITAINDAPVASSVSITDTNGGSVVVGDSLTGNYSYSDVDGDLEGVSTFRWLRGSSPISGATTTSYTLVTADSGQSITFEVTPVAATGTTTGSAVTSSGISVVNSAPVASSVSITDTNGGSVVVGDSLTGNYSYSDVDGDLEGGSTFRWLRGGSPISGATTTSYTLVTADSGQSITFEVTPVAATGTTTGSAVTSSGISVVNSAPVASGVSITDTNGGNAVVGDSLTGNYSYSDVDGDLEGVSTFRWLRGGSPISGATSSSYTLVTADSGQSITFEVTPLAATGTMTGSAVTSSGITVVNNAPVASSVTIADTNGGSVVVGDSLTGNYSYSDVDGDLEGVTTFRWLRGGSPISGATSSSYTVVAADSGQSITFEVTPVAATGTMTGSAVTSSGITVVNTPPSVTSQSITINEDSPVVITLGSDVDEDSLTNTITVAPTHGVISGTGPTVTYTPTSNYNGADTFSFTLNDGTDDSATGTITITVTAVNDAPVANDDAITTSAGKTAVPGTLTASDTENDNLTFQLLTLPTKGTVTLDNATTGAFTYTPTTLGADSFTFNVTDDAASPRESNVATITVNAPVAMATPATPINEAVLAGDQRVSLSWDAVDYAESYNVYWSTTTGVTTATGTPVNVDKPYYYHDGLSNNTPYYYIVTAVNSLGESVATGEMSATPVDIALSGLVFADTNLATCVSDAAITAGATYVHDLAVLDCGGLSISDLTGIEQLTSLGTLYLRNNTIADISPLSNLTKLFYLLLNDNAITSGISALTDLNDMFVLSLANTGTTDITPLSNMSAMYNLVLNNNTISNLEPLAGMTGLNYLLLGSNNISDISPLSALTNLQILNVDSNHINSISAVSAMTSLTELHVATNNIFDLSPLPAATGLVEMSLFENNIFNLDPLSGITSLLRLRLFSNNISDLTPLSGLLSLEELYLAHNLVTDVSPLAGLTNLNTLFVRDNKIGGEGIGHVDSLVTLTSAASILLTDNPTMSCNELNALISELGSVVTPNPADPGVNCTAP